jgi:P4 family phage/plasmid primase-like protien
MGEGVDFVTFVREMHSRIPQGYGIELRRVPGKINVYSPEGLTEPADLGKANYYWGVIPRAILTKDVDKVYTVWCDTDGSVDDPYKIDPSPSVILHSGRVNGFHLYWRLNETVPAEDCSRLSKIITVALKGDFNVCTKALAFRAPFSVNTKYDPPREVKILKYELGTEYAFLDLEERMVAAVFAPYYIDGERHALTLAITSLLARCGWEQERTLRAIEHLYNMSPGQDMKGKLNDVRSTYSRIALGEPISIQKLKQFLDKTMFSRLLQGLGMSARDGDVTLEGEVIAKLANIERDLVNHFLTQEEWVSAAGKVAQWREDHWHLSDDGILASEIFQMLGRLKYVKQSDLLDLPATSKLARAVSSMATGQLHKNPMPSADHHLLPLTNGTLDLRDLSISQSKKADRHLWVLPVVYDKDAQAPSWEAFIEEAAPDPSVRDHLQEWMGYMLMAGNHWERMLWIYGKEGTGKSTYIKAAKMLLGPAAVAVSSDKFSDYTIAQLAGTRLGICTELSPRLLRTSVVKALVSGDPVQGRHPYGKPFSVEFDGKLVWASNELPPLDQGEGMWRRMVPVEFGVFPKKRDNSLKYKIAREASGILNWAIIGLRRLLEIEDHGESWMLPASVQHTIDSYKAASDPIKAFAEEEIDRSDPDAHTPVLEVYQRWTSYAKDRGVYVRPLDPIFFQDLERVGLPVDPTFSNGLGPKVIYLRGGKLIAGIFGDFGKKGEN